MSTLIGAVVLAGALAALIDQLRRPVLTPAPVREKDRSSRRAR